MTKGNEVKRNKKRGKKKVDKLKQIGIRIIRKTSNKPHLRIGVKNKAIRQVIRDSFVWKSNRVKN